MTKKISEERRSFVGNQYTFAIKEDNSKRTRHTMLIVNEGIPVAIYQDHLITPEFMCYEDMIEELMRNLGRSDWNQFVTMYKDLATQPESKYFKKANEVLAKVIAEFEEEVTKRKELLES